MQDRCTDGAENITVSADRAADRAVSSGQAAGRPVSDSAVQGVSGVPEIRISPLGGDHGGCRLVQKNGVFFGRFPILERMEWLNHCFSTRLGGVSEGCYASMDLGPGRGDSDAAVRENYRRLGEAAGFDWRSSVLTKQTHTVNIRRVFREDAGKGLLRERDYDNVDGLITDCPGLPLFSFSADCTVTMFADPVHRAVGVAHAGWRGMAARMGREMILAMGREFGTRPKDLVCAIAPSICRDCFEVGPEVAQCFAEAFPENAGRIIFPGRGDRSQIDLWEAGRIVLAEAGVPAENIAVTNLCTKCNPDLFFSHRVTGPARGIGGCMIEVRP